MDVDVRLVSDSSDLETRRLLGALDTAGVRADVARWSDGSVDWGEAGVTLLRTAAGRHRDRSAFLAWAVETAERTRLFNPEPLVVWNSHRSYLAVLHRMRVPVVPSRLISGGLTEAWGRMEEEGWEDAVLKPAVGPAGEGVLRLSHHDAVGLTDLRGDWVLQPFVPSVRERGEVSVVVVDGEVTHSVAVPAGGRTYRGDRGPGTPVEPIVPDPDWREVAERAVAFARPEPLYARVDLVEYDGSPHVMELALVAPRLYLAEGGSATARLVEAVTARLGAGRRERKGGDDE